MRFFSAQSRRAFITVLAAALPLTGCVGELSGGSERDLANTARVESDRLTFPASVLDGYQQLDARGEPRDVLEMVSAYQHAAARGASETAEPVYLVGDRADSAKGADGTVEELSTNPFGFARKAVGFTRDGENIVVATEPASLEQVIGDVDLEGAISMGPPGEEGGPTARPQAGFDGTIAGPSIPRIDLTGRELWRRGNSVLRLGTTYLDLSSTIDYGLNVRLARLSRARLVIHGQLDSQVVLEATTGVDFGNHEVRRELFATRLVLPPAGPVPLTLRISVTAGCNMGGRADLNASAGVRASVTSSVGFDYERGGAGLRGIGDVDFTHRPVRPVFTVNGNIGVRCYLEPKYEVLFFDSVGPHNSLNVYADLRFTSPPARVEMTTGMQGLVGGTARIFSFDLGSLNLPPVFDVRQPTYSGPSR
jgi:hypothetical protein